VLALHELVMPQTSVCHSVLSTALARSYECGTDRFCFACHNQESYKFVAYHADGPWMHMIQISFIRPNRLDMLSYKL
jgi:hypothetical protein